MLGIARLGAVLAWVVTLWLGVATVVVARDAPAIQPFQNATFQSLLTTEFAGLETKLAGEGVLAPPSGAAFTTYLMGQPIDTIIVDDAIYTRSELYGPKDQWYVKPDDAVARGSSASLVNLFRPLQSYGGLLTTAGLAKVGATTLNGHAVVQYRVDGGHDLARRLGLVEAEAAAGVATTFHQVSLELWTRSDTGYIVRARVAAEGSAPWPIASGASSGQVNQSARTVDVKRQLLLKFGDFDQSAPIAAPVGAIPLPTP